MNIYQQTNTVLGTQALITLTLPASYGQPNQLFDELWQYIDQFDRAFSRFLPNSELTELNNRAGEHITVSSELKRQLIKAKEVSEITGGLYNPFILPALQRMGYKKSWIDASKEGPDFSHRDIAMASSLLIDGDTVLMPANAAIDLGGIGKGYLLDELGDVLSNKGVKNFWISLGGDILVSGQMGSGKAWDIDIADALQPSKVVATIKVPKTKRLAIATSGTTRRKGIHNGEAWHHIIDPTTGKSAKTDIVTATVCMTTATLADVYASCIVALGSKDYQAFMKTHTINDVAVQVQASDQTNIMIDGKLIKQVENA